MNDITIVTAFFDIGRGEWTNPVHGRPMPHYIPRTTETYFSYFENLSKIKNDMVIYTSSDMADKIKSIRDRNAPDALTSVVAIDFNESTKAMRNVVQKIQSRPEYADLMIDPHMPEYWNADYVIVNFMKTDFVNNAYDNGFINTELAAWIDFGYARDDKTIPKNGIWKYNFDPTKMHYFNKIPIDERRPIFDIIRTNTVYIMGCHIVGGRSAWKNNLKLSYRNLSSMIRCGLIDDDQTILLMNYKDDPTNIELHHIDAEKNGWYVVMQNFNED